MRKDTKCATQCPGNTKALSISKADSALLRQRITEGASQTLIYVEGRQDLSSTPWN